MTALILLLAALHLPNLDIVLPVAPATAEVQYEKNRHGRRQAASARRRAHG